jgi:hypothetical protein
MVTRPGNLSGFQGMSPRNKSSFGSSYSSLGNFNGKGAFTPPPSAPPGGAPPGSKAIDNAVDKRTGKFYMQDPKCPEGEATSTKGMPCKGKDCCDGGDCDPEGTVYQEKDCFDDPNYRELPEEPAQGFTSCQARTAAGYPGPCSNLSCPSCFQKAPAQAQARASQAAPQASKSPEEQALEDAEKAKLEGELQQLEMAQSHVDSMVTQAPVMAPPGAYTGGGGGGGMPRRARRSAPTAQSKIESMVSAHETRKAMQRSSSAAPPAIIRRSAPAAAAPARPTPPAETGGLFSWLRGAFFGPSNLDGWGFGETKKANMWIPILVTIGLLYYFTAKKPATSARGR